MLAIGKGLGDVGRGARYAAAHPSLYKWVALPFVISLVILFFFMRYRRRSRGEVGATAEMRTLPLELTWSVIPLIIALGMFAWGVKVFFITARPPSDAVEYWVTGKQWMWKMQHPEGPREINDLHVPVGEGRVAHVLDHGRHPPHLARDNAIHQPQHELCVLPEDR